jgi:hypothetical protein
MNFPSNGGYIEVSLSRGVEAAAKGDVVGRRNAKLRGKCLEEVGLSTTRVSANGLA